MDYSQVRQQKSRNEAVAVNHRALITRTLTKYPIDYALFRELLQNSADAKATTATIQFVPVGGTDATEVAVKDLHVAQVGKLEFRNNGQNFETDDWDRLKEIARGNPNETKIGAFGVGFYSVFEITDEPLVHSGTKIMNFHYEGDQLQFARSEGPVVNGTVIDLPYRTPTQLPDLVKFTAFLVQSFVLVPLEKVELKVGSLSLLTLTKTVKPAQQLAIPKGLVRKSPNGILAVSAVNSTPVEISVHYLNATQMPPATLTTTAGLFSFGRKLVQSLVTGSEDPAEYTTLNCYLRRLDATLSVSVSSSFKKQMIATVMKPPPPQTTMSLLAYSEDDAQRSDIKPPLSDYIFPREFGDAKVFIGFPTKQTTALKSHLAINQLIPTMERTAVDMSHAFVKDWNNEILYMAGVLARYAYESELAALATSKKDDVAAQLAGAKFTIERFELGTSAPDPRVGDAVSSGFWQGATSALLPTQHGILPSSDVRLPGTSGKLLRSTPVVVDEPSITKFVGHLQQSGLVRPATLAEVTADLKEKPVDFELFKRAVEWFVQTVADQPVTSREQAAFRAALVVTKDKASASLAKMVYFQSKAVVAEGLPIPETCLPAKFVNDIPHRSLKALGLAPLSVPVWIASLAETPQLFARSAPEILAALSSVWSSLSDKSKHDVASVLSRIKSIPTQSGLQYPRDVHIEPVTMFPNLPVISASLDVSKRFLVGIGLRESVDMAFVLEALHNPHGDFVWTNVSLVDYLATNRSSLKSDDWQLLRQGAFFRSDKTGRLAGASELYRPDSELKKLGFSTLQWPAEKPPSSAHEDMLADLGVRRPDVAQLFAKALERQLVPTALRYYLANYNKSEMAKQAVPDLPIVPTEGGGYSKPSQTFVEAGAKAFGFSVLDATYAPHAPRLGVARAPKVPTLVDRLLASPPTSLEQAGAMFTLLSRYTNALTPAMKAALRERAFIPTKNGLARPTAVYFSSGTSGELVDLFSFVDGLPEAAQPFLYAVGVRHSPVLSDVVVQMAKEPEHVLRMVGSPAKYRQLLGRVAGDWSTLARDRALVESLKRSPFLLGLQYSEESDADEAVPVLARAADIAIVDDVTIFTQFRHRVTTAPQIDSLEQLYKDLGSVPLSQQLVESVRVGAPVAGSEKAEGITKRVQERLRLFLESTSKERRIKPRDAGKYSVQFVSSIDVRRRLKTTPEVAVATTAYIDDRTRERIYLVQNFDWFDVAQALAKRVMARPDPESVVVLEMQLGTSLEVLQRKGYNVKRLLRQQEEEKLAFAPQPQSPPQQLQQSPQLPQQSQRSDNMPGAMPGAFPGQPPRPPPRQPDQAQVATRPDASGQQRGQSQQSAFAQAEALAKAHARVQATSQSPATQALQGFKSFFTGKRNDQEPLLPPQPQHPGQPGQLGQQQQQLSQGRSPAPAPGQAQSGLGQAQSGLGQAQRGPGQVQTQVQGGGAAATAQGMQNALAQGVGASRSYNHDMLRSAQHIDAPTVPPQMCDAETGKELEAIGILGKGTKLFRRPGVAVDAGLQAVADDFEALLYRCAGLFGVPVQALNVYVDSLGSIAFNYGGALFFNLAVYFENLKENTDYHVALDYWFPVMAHELAHNLVSSHGSQHSFFTESYIQNYLAGLRSLR